MVGHRRYASVLENTVFRLNMPTRLSKTLKEYRNRLAVFAKDRNSYVARDEHWLQLMGMCVRD